MEIRPKFIHIIELSKHHELGFRTCAQSVQLIVLKDGVELACRKATRRELAAFLKGGDGQAFKGRLQLRFNGPRVDVEVKGAVVGRISRRKFGIAVEAVFHAGEG